jgi:hypothetical protein
VSDGGSGEHDGRDVHRYWGHCSTFGECQTYIRGLPVILATAGSARYAIVTLTVELAE